MSIIGLCWIVYFDLGCFLEKIVVLCWWIWFLFNEILDLSMGGVIVGIYFFFIFVVLLLFLSIFVELNEIWYDLWYFCFKIVDESEREGSNGFGGEILDLWKEIKNILVGGSDLDVVGIMIIFFEFGLNYVKEVLVD